MLAINSPGWRFCARNTSRALRAAHVKWPIAKVASSEASLIGFPVSCEINCAHSWIRSINKALHASNTLRRPEKPSSCQSLEAPRALATALCTSADVQIGCVLKTSPVEGLYESKVEVAI